MQSGAELQSGRADPSAGADLCRLSKHGQYRSKPCAIIGLKTELLHATTISLSPGIVTQSEGKKNQRGVFSPLIFLQLLPSAAGPPFPGSSRRPSRALPEPCPARPSRRAAPGRAAPAALSGRTHRPPGGRWALQQSGERGQQHLAHGAGGVGSAAPSAALLQPPRPRPPPGLRPRSLRMRGPALRRSPGQRPLPARGEMSLKVIKGH